MSSRSRKRRRSQCARSLRADDNDSDVLSSSVDSDQQQQDSQPPQNVLDGGKFRPNCDYIKCLEQWVQYAEHVSFDYRVDLYTYIFKGHAILAAHQRMFYKHPSRYLWFLMSLPASDDASDAAHQALVRSATARVHEMLESHQLLEQLVMGGHAGEHGQCEAKSGALGWSAATQLWHVVCIFRFHIAMVQQLLYTFEHDARATAQLRHVRSVPRDQSVIELCGVSYDGDVPSATSVLPRSMCPPELLHSAATLAPALLELCCTLYPHQVIGLYSQFQVYEQLAFLSQQFYDINVGHEALPLFIRALQLRVCELIHHTYVAPTAWNNALLPCDVTPSRPLDMVPPERYRLAHRFSGVSPSERPMTVDLSAVTNGSNGASKSKNTPYEYRPDKASDKEQVSPSRAFIDEVLGLIAPMYRQLVLVRNIIQPPICIVDDQQPMSPVRQQLLERWTVQCAMQCTRKSRVCITFQMLQRVFEGMMDYQRSRIVDLSYRDDVCVHIRRMCLTSNLPERYAHAPANLFARTYNSELLENAFLPRAVFQARNEQWRQLELHELEQAPYIPHAARAYVQMCVMRTLGYVRGEDESWLQNYAVFHYQLEQLSDRMHLDDSPFILVLGARCYVRRGDKFLTCYTVREAMLVWLLFIVLDHPLEHRRDCSKCVSTTGWVALAKQLVDNALKSSETGALVPTYTARQRRRPLGPLDIDTHSTSSSSSEHSDEDHSSNSDSMHSGDSDAESSESDQEELLVEQYMQCDDLL